MAFVIMKQFEILHKYCKGKKKKLNPQRTTDSCISEKVPLNKPYSRDVITTLRRKCRYSAVTVIPRL